VDVRLFLHPLVTVQEHADGEDDLLSVVLVLVPLLPLRLVRDVRVLYQGIVVMQIVSEYKIEHSGTQRMLHKIQKVLFVVVLNHSEWRLLLSNINQLIF